MRLRFSASPFRMGLRLKLVLFLLLITLVLGVVLAFVYEGAMREMLIRQTVAYTSQSLQQLSNRLGDVIDDTSRTALSLIHNQNWDVLLEDGGQSDLIRLFLDNAFRQYAQHSLYVQSILLIDARTLTIHAQADDSWTLSYRRRFVQELLDMRRNVPSDELNLRKVDGAVRLMPPSLRGKSLFELIVPLPSGQTPLGYLLVYLEDALIGDLWKNQALPNEMEIFLVDEAGGIVLADRYEPLSPALIELYRTESQGQAVQAGRSVHMISAPTRYPQWRLMALIPVRVLEIQIRQAVGGAVRSFVWVPLVLSLLIVGFVHGLFTRPVQDLVAQLREDADWQAVSRRLADRHDEFGQILRAFARLLEERSELATHLLEQQLLNREAQMKLLYMQMNPHFLFNALDSIRWQSMDLTGGENGCSRSLVCLSNMLRQSVDTERDKSSLEEEIAFARDYCCLQQSRFGEGLRVEWSIEIDDASVQIPRFMLQPLIENAVLHGIEPMQDGGCVRIAIARKGQTLVLQVSDSGVGVPGERRALLLDLLEGRTHGGKESRGLSNLARRLRLAYGER
ncbi:MAG TPA: histidine kinase, partial [Clostridia bacterium]|nr:histidine kinase [Clostridia bacterium]